MFNHTQNVFMMFESNFFKKKKTLNIIVMHLKFNYYNIQHYLRFVDYKILPNKDIMDL